MGGSSWETPKYLTQTQDNGFILIGSTHSNDKDVSGNHSVGDGLDIWMVKTDSTGELLWQQCFGGAGHENPWGHFIVAKKSDHNYVLAPITNSGTSLSCFTPNPEYPYNNWVFEIKDCSQYQPSIPQQPSGQDHLCVNTDSITTYTTQPASGAWYYEWKLLPENSGTITQDSITTQIQWNPTYEGPATLKVRSSNDCGTSAWSDSLIVETYMCLGSEEFNDRRLTFSIYPNPVSSKLTVSYKNHSSNKPVTIELLDMYGSIAITQSMPEGKQLVNIDVTSLAKSLYLVRVVESGEIVGVRKVVVE